MATAAKPQPRPPTAAEERRVAVMKRRDDLIAYIERFAGEIEKLAPRGSTPAFYVASLRLYFAQNEALLACKPVSIANGMLRVAQTGLTLGESCDLLPFKDVCQFSPRYNGIVQLALASGVRAVNLGVVREGDFFEFEKGTRLDLHHRPIAKSDAPITYGYALAEIKPGSYSLEVMTREQIDAHRAKFSRSWWKDKAGRIMSLEEVSWYAKKTPLRQLSPVLPKSPRFAAALVFEKEIETDPDEDIPEGTFEVEGESASQPAAATAATTAEAPTPEQQVDWEFQDDRSLDDYPNPGRGR